MAYKEVQLVLLFWKLGLVDTFNALRICINCGSQYMSVVGASAAGNPADLGIKLLLEPILGLGTSWQFVQAAATAVERRQRVAALASFFAASAGALTTDPATNIAMGATVGSKIGDMRAILARGGGTPQIKQSILIPSLKNFGITVNPIKTPLVTPLLNPAQMEFYQNCNLITQNIFAEHTTRRYANGLAQKGRNLLTFSGPLVLQVTTQGSLASLIGYSCLGIGISVIMIYGGLHMIRNAKKKHYKIVVKPSERVIDVTASEIDD